MKYLFLILISLTVTLANKEEQQQFTSSSNLFTGAVYNELVKTHKDFLVSPFAVQNILALTQSGAKGETAEEIRTSLRLPNSTEKIESLFKALLPTIKSNSLYSLHTATKIYVKDNLKLDKEFKKVAKEVYHADLENINFVDSFGTAKAINDWVEKQTQNKIHDVISSDILNEKTRLILINALYFKGNWSKSFDTGNTKKTNFYKTAKDFIEVDTMHADGASYNYYESSDLNAKFLEMPFEGGDISMTIVLPNEKEGLATLEKQIDKVFVAPKFSEEKVNVALPKFKIESDIDFYTILQNLGVRKVFNDEADLSGISGDRGDLLVNKFKQKTFIDVNEVGVEAAAVTYVVEVAALIISEPEPEPKSFIADHPFIFYIKIKDLIIFGGRVLEPEQ